MTRVTVIVAMISALCIGSALGFAGGVLFSHHALGLGPPMAERGFRGERRGPPGVPSSRMLVPHLVRMLDLTPGQADSIREEVEASRTEFAQVRDSLHARIERHLTPAQRDRWREMVRERHSENPRGRDPHPAPPGTRSRAEPGTEGEMSR
jgi:hypothetical protein